MYLFTRTTRLAGGNGADGIEWATEAAGKVKEITGNDLELWAGVFGPGFGTIMWTAWYADLKALETAGDALQGDASYEQVVSRGAQLTEGGLDDGLIQLIHGEPDPSRELQYVGSVQAVCAAGNVSRAMELGVEIADAASSATGLPTLFARGLTGPYGGVGWMTGYENIEQYQEAQEALAADEAMMRLVDSTAGVFAEDPAVTQAALLRKLA